MVLGISQDIINYMIAFGGLFFMFFLAANWLSAGFFWTFLRVKASRGKKVLTEVRAQTDTYFRAGVVVKSTLRFKDRNKHGHIIGVPVGGFEQAIGVRKIRVDEVKDAVIMPNGNMVPGFDAEEMDNFANALATKPNIQNNRKEVILAGIALALILVGLYIIYVKLDAVYATMMALREAGLVGNV